MSALRRVLLTVVASFALAVPSAALAADSSVEGYGGPGGSVESSIGDESTGSPAASSAPALDSSPAASAAQSRSQDSGNSLPFTGLDVGFVAAVGLGLLLMGYGLSLLVRHHRSVPALAAAAPSGHGQSLPPVPVSNENEPALVVAMEMMIDGNTQTEVSAYLREVFRIDDADGVAAEAFRRSQARNRSALAMNVGMRLGHGR